MKVLKPVAITWVLAVAVLFASELQAQTHEHPNEAQTMMPAGCPMNLDGVEFEIEDIRDGVAVIFEAGPDDLQALRQRVRQAASMLERMGTMMAGGHNHATQSGAEGATGENDEEDALHSMMGGMNMTHWPAIESVITTETETGIQLELHVAPENLSNLTELRGQVGNMTAHLESGQCMMMQMMGHMHGPIDESATPEAEHDHSTQ